jgi:transaldolase
MARIGKPQYVNVFMGRLGAFTSANDLGDGKGVGERALMASQRVIRELREAGQTPARQIAASIRNGQQVADSAGVDVLTIPPSSAKDFLYPGLGELANRTTTDFKPLFADGVDPSAVRFDTLWDVDDALVACIDTLEAEDLDAMTPDALVTFFHDHACGDLLPRWSEDQIATCAAEGKIPKLETWREALAAKTIGVDSLMDLAGLLSFTADQQAMDDRVAGLL